jgi:hypothetical protein
MDFRRSGVAKARQPELPIRLASVTFSCSLIQVVGQVLCGA